MFFVFATAVVVVVSVFLRWRFRDLFGEKLRRLVDVIAVVFALAVLGIVPAHFFQSRVIGFIAFLALGLGSLIFTFRVMGDIGLLGSRLVRVDEERRRFLRRAVDVGTIGAAASTFGYGYYKARQGPERIATDIFVDDLHPDLEGLKIVQLSDIHVGPTVDRAFLEPIVAMTMAEKPDIIAVTGDLVDGSVQELQDAVSVLAGLRAPLGTFFVTGNHEYYSGAESWLRHVQTLGFTTLVNENRVVTRGGAKLLVGGVTDFAAHTVIAHHQSDPVSAGLCEHAVDYRLLLAHQPRSAFDAERAGFDLQLSGHTHGGQFFPWNFVIHLVQPFVAGLYRHAKMQVYVNRGTAYWGPPLRIGPSSELTVLTLRRS